MRLDPNVPAVLPEERFVLLGYFIDGGAVVAGGELLGRHALALHSLRTASELDIASGIKQALGAELESAAT